MYSVYIYNKYGEIQAMYQVEDTNSLKNIGIAYTNTSKIYYSDFHRMKYLKEIDLDCDFAYKNYENIVLHSYH